MPPPSSAHRSRPVPGQRRPEAAAGVSADPAGSQAVLADTASWAYSAAPWQTFAAAEVGAAAALTGLLFVAVSINLERILAFPKLPASRTGSPCSTRASWSRSVPPATSSTRRGTSRPSSWSGPRPRCGPPRRTGPNGMPSAPSCTPDCPGKGKPCPANFTWPWPSMASAARDLTPAVSVETSAW